MIYTFVGSDEGSSEVTLGKLTPPNGQGAYDRDALVRFANMMNPDRYGQFKVVTVYSEVEPGVEWLRPFCVFPDNWE